MLRERDVSSGPELRDVVVRGFLVSVALNAALGIWALLASDFGDIEGRVLATSFCVTGAMLAVLAIARPLGARVAWPLPAVAVGCATCGFAMAIASIWAEIDADAWWKMLGSLFVVGGAATLVSLVATLVVRREHEPARTAQAAVTGLLAVLILLAIWVETDGEPMLRLIGIASVLTAALTLIVPVLARARPADGADERAPVECPNCGHHFAVEASAV